MTSGEISTVIHQLGGIEAQITAAVQALNEARALQNTLSDAVLKGVQTPLKPPSTAATHLREHRPGRPSKIDCDAELRAFILTRIDTTTYPALAKAVADHFPPDRRVGKSAIHQWWQKQPKSIPKSHPK